MILKKVISGAQTGADRAGLKAAKTFGISVGGWMPKGFIALDGNHPEFAKDYGIRQHKSPEYPPRTRQNVLDSDGTVRFAANWKSRGERRTLKEIEAAEKPHFDVDIGGEFQPSDLARWIEEHGIRTLNVAGNAEEAAPGIEAFVIDFLTKTFELLASEGPHDPSAGERSVCR